MKSKSRKTVRGTLQEWEMIPITDPVEFAALDRRCREAEKHWRAVEKALEDRAKSKRAKPRKGK
jgi:hypothetical protein